MLIGMIVLLGVGLLSVALGALLWKRQRISLVNEWHTRNVKPEDVPAYTRLMGFGLIALGAGCALTGVVALGLKQPVGWIALAAGFVAGIALMIRAQRRYNGGVIIS